MMKDNVINAVQALAAPGRARPPASGTEGGRVEPQLRPEGGKELPSSQVPELPQPDLSGVVESLNNYLQTVQRDLQFSVDDASGRTVITVMDSENKEVIRQIPPESVLALADTLREGGELGSFGIAEKA